MPGDAELYCTPEGLVGIFTEAAFNALMGRTALDDRPAFLRSALLSATARINAAAQKGGYVDLPFRADILDAQFADQSLKILERNCGFLAMEDVAATWTNVPDMLKESVRVAEAWLANLAAGKIDILGATRPTASVAAAASGAVLAVADADFLAPGIHSAIGRIGPW
jgi:hypothetical protein